MANTGCREDTRPLALKFLRIFKDYPYVVCPSGSCVSMVRHHYDEYLEGQPGFEHLKHHTFELCEFLTDVLKVEQIGGRFPHKVGLHNSCHGHRELRLGSASELMVPRFNKVRQLLATVEGIEFTELKRPDECCGFGGTFAVNEEADLQPDGSGSAARPPAGGYGGHHGSRHVVPDASAGADPPHEVAAAGHARRGDFCRPAT